METSNHVATQDLSSNARNNESAHSVAKKSGRFPFVPVILTGAIIAGVGIWHFSSPAKATTAANAAATSAPVAVGVQTVTRQKLRIWNDFSGRLHAVDSADIRPEVSGLITEVRFQDGQSVNAGDILFVIDPRPFEAAVAHAEARIASAKAALQFAAAEQTRNVSMLHSKTIAQREFDRTDSANAGAAADLKAAEADLKTAQVDLDHAYVKAPITGRVSRAELTLGNLVQSGAGAPLLTSVVSENGIYADFEVDEQTYLATIRDSAKGNVQEKTIPVELVIPGDGGHVYKGFIQNFDNRINTESGTIRARAKFDNADETLLPGMFASVRLASSREHDMLLVADRAIGYDQNKKFLFVVAPDNKVRYQEVELGAELGGQRVIVKGIETGDRVVVDGTQRVRADAEVTPQEVPISAQAGVASTQKGN